jgi:hypothetical protein
VLVEVSCFKLAAARVSGALPQNEVMLAAARVSGALPQNEVMLAAARTTDLRTILLVRESRRHRSLLSENRKKK